MRFLPAPGGAKPLSEPQVQAVVAAGVERLTPDNVVVVMTPAGVTRSQNKQQDEAQAAAAAGNGMAMGKNSRLMLLVGVGLVLALCLGLAASQIRLRTVRGRLTRLQGEIAKARRKPTDMPPPQWLK